MWKNLKVFEKLVYFRVWNSVLEKVLNTSALHEISDLLTITSITELKETAGLYLTVFMQIESLPGGTM